MSLVLSRIHTCTGDAGTTAPGGASRTRETDPGSAAYADTDETDTDETDTAIGVVLALGDPEPLTRAVSARPRQDLFVLARRADAGGAGDLPWRPGDSR
ncbi:hypothetical protein [Embleya scabrispora]|uniref:hypothetical protein n=1 Tax=Embleya scabrispora TaxID=159449 RepID=UPI00036478B1|nr:hypothetical protein [Embleya scabrispora]MYS81218.1 hypothetical protein [Streptomyces sp. SID5474]